MATHPEHQVDPRVQRSRMVILRAAVEELAEEGYGAFTIESVAARAGVGKGTLYRRFTDKGGLAVALLDQREPQTVSSLTRSDGRGGGPWRRM